MRSFTRGRVGTPRCGVHSARVILEMNIARGADGPPRRVNCARRPCHLDCWNEN